MPVSMDARTKSAIKQYERDPSCVNAISLVSQLMIGDTALNLVALLLLLSCVWCASGLIAIDAAKLWVGVWRSNS